MSAKQFGTFPIKRSQPSKLTTQKQIVSPGVTSFTPEVDTSHILFKGNSLFLTIIKRQIIYSYEINPRTYRFFQ